METKIIGFDQVDLAVKSLNEGNAVCFPTETVFGIGVKADRQENFDRLVAIKRRPPEKPFTLMCASLTPIARLAEVDARSIAVMKRFMPGMITVLLKAREGVPHYLTLGLPTIGFRVPDDQDVINMIDKAGYPLLVPSANPSGLAPALDSKTAKGYFDSEVEYVIDGECRSNTPSTIVDLSVPGKPKLIREGPIKFDEIVKVYYQKAPAIALGCDHGAFALKEHIKSHLAEMGFDCLDEGTHSASSCDYPIFAKKVGEDVADGKAELGIVCCTSGEGVCIAANKVKGIRCGIGYDDVVTGKVREHNDGNVVSFGAAYMKEEDVLRRVDIFLTEKFSSLQKHHRRVDEIE